MWRTRRGSLIGLIAGIGFWSTASFGLAQEDELIARGELEYQVYCAVCHGEKAKGDGAMAEQLTIEPADLTQISKRHGGTFPFGRIYRIIDGREEVKAHGSRDMPVWGAWFRVEEAERNSTEWADLAHGRIWQLTAYLQSIQEKEQ